MRDDSDMQTSSCSADPMVIQTWIRVISCKYLVYFYILLYLSRVFILFVCFIISFHVSVYYCVIIHLLLLWVFILFVYFIMCSIITIIEINMNLSRVGVDLRFILDTSIQMRLTIVGLLVVSIFWIHSLISYQSINEFLLMSRMDVETFYILCYLRNILLFSYDVDLHWFNLILRIFSSFLHDWLLVIAVI